MQREKLFKDFLKNKKDLEIRDQLIEMHLPLVKKIANQFKYFPKSLQREDLYQEGILGLIKALDKYKDLGYGFYGFINYAKELIKGEITELIRGLQTASTPLKLVFRKEKQTSNIPFEEWEEAKQPRWSTILNPHQLWLKQDNHELFLKKLKNILNYKEFEIIKLSFGIPLGNVNEEPQIEYSNKNIGQMLNLSSRKVAIIKNKAIKKLKKIYKKGNK
ncbi:sigma-70 family RNA polymerase sigma factor [Candidatus Phytoplasma australiense]|uniref:DNA-Directed RNA Polymerase Sigma Subunit n=1 Tax=Strawberry lethal yellows phytoplasma (CPA) str. NZSb11 TaxID=980422 RepID=R4RWE0_PHYAS|nr:sigma-70 family RNA polymerase sigma factor [Candidatus Phytoplasma australiense]AGL89979.1 DNA-Directed RNA Polymerase Sigma Subunit [Strawberry lethal yellows phytoplasma (CPA) str. NZSb11]AGL90177.1 DNA-Directed RNA Polymerase Sigma Subunit [Strawberry lethal yellows phytoplasma (CPA) str. NZSb11]AGL90649.1 DNA-Directed RNA Polymerase Sigma Subunit [Strawberry lethal yellows phytoplasma (CPA) str. NZSb11]